MISSRVIYLKMKKKTIFKLNTFENLKQIILQILNDL